jgi:hypothetical protein
MKTLILLSTILLLSACTTPSGMKTSSAVENIRKKGDVLWKYRDEGRFVSPVALDPSGKTLFISVNGPGRKGAIYSTDTKTWRDNWGETWDDSDAWPTSPVLSVGHNSFFLGSWEFDLDTGLELTDLNRDSPHGAYVAVGSDGDMYTSKNKTSISAWNPNSRREKWSWKVPVDKPLQISNSILHENPMPVIDGKIFIGSNGKTYALECESGKVAWTCEGSLIDAVLTESGLIIVSALYLDDERSKYSESGMFAVNPSGKKVWEFKHKDVSGNTQSWFHSPVIGKDNTVYTYLRTPQINRKVNKRLAINGGTGEIKWEVPSEGELGGMVLGKDGLIYSVTLHDSWARVYTPQNGYIHKFQNVAKVTAIDTKNGDEIWNATMPELWPRQGARSRITAPAMGPKGILYFTAVNTVYAIYTEAGGPEESSWPMLGGDSQRSGRTNFTKNENVGRSVTSVKFNRNEYQRDKESLVKMFIAGEDWRAAWVLGEQTRDPVKKYQWWMLANMVAISSGSGEIGKDAFKLVKRKIESDTKKRAEFTRWHQILVGKSRLLVGRPLRVLLREIAPLLP